MKHAWKTSSEKIEALSTFFSMIKSTKTFNRKISEYSIKSLFAQYARKTFDIDGYTYSDEFVFYAKEHGFKFKEIHTDKYGMSHGWLNMSHKDLTKIKKFTNK